MVQEVKGLKTWLVPYQSIHSRVEEASGLAEMLEAEPDEAMLAELASEVDSIGAALDRFELQAMLRGPGRRP